jgi:PKD repeat protein
MGRGNRLVRWPSTASKIAAWLVAVATVISACDRVNQPPVAAITADPTSGVAPLAVSFDASASSDPDGRIVQYAWDFGDGNTYQDTAAVATHTFTTAGNYTVRLTVSDDRGTRHDATAGIAVLPAPAVSEVSIDQGDTQIAEDATLQLTASVATVGGADRSVTWSSDAAHVASVSSAGLVTAHSVGSTTITATSVFDDTKSDTVTITVAYSIQLDMTAMVDTGVDLCGTEKQLAVAPGTTVRYCYRVTNISSITLGTHDLVDDQLGSILAGFAYNLMPGASVFLTQTTVITATTTSTATWTASTLDDTAQDTDTVTVTVPPPSLQLEMTAMVDTGEEGCGSEEQLTVAPGTTVRYCYTVTNTGIITLGTHDLVDDQLGSILTGFAYDLIPGASAFLTQTAVITATTTSTATWTATTPDDTAQDTDTVTVAVTPP